MRTEDYLEFRKQEKYQKWKPRTMHEAFAHVLEELGEATQAGGKMLRFGYLNKWKGRQNVDRFIEEMDDVVHAYQEFRTWWKNYDKKLLDK